MSAQRNQSSTSQAVSRSEQQRDQQSSLARRSAIPSVSSLLLDPLGFFDDSPFAVMRRMQDELNRTFSGGGRRSGRGDLIADTVWVPPIEVALQDGNFVISAELPGISDEDVTVSIEDDAVVIQGERQVQREENQGGIRRTELRYGQFYRAIPLPDGADPDQATAEFRNGVLRITVPISQAQSNTRQIPIQTSGTSQSTQGQTGTPSGQSQQAAEQRSTSETPSGQKAA